MARLSLFFLGAAALPTLLNAFSPNPSFLISRSATSSTPYECSTTLSVTADAEARARAAMEEEESSGGEASGTDFVDNSDRPFPLSMIVGQDDIKQSLLLAAVNSKMGGVVISGRKGTAKSAMARAVHRLLPPIERLKDSAFNIDPEGLYGMDDFLKADIANGGVPLEERETEVIKAPFVQVPLNVMEDRLLGSADLEESVKTGKSVFSPGLLAKAHRGVLYVDDINLLDEETANILLNIINEGVVNVEREGISVRYPCRPLLIATFNPDEGELRDHLLDRIAVALSADAVQLSLEQRVEVVDAVTGFSPADGSSRSSEAAQALADAEENESDLATAIVFAREYIKELKIAGSQILYLCEEAIRAGCQGHRAEIFASEVARASAALNGRQVNSDDLKLAVKLAIAPRGTFINSPEDMEEDMMPPPPPPPPPPQMDETDDDQQDEEDNEEEEQDEPDDEEDENQEEEALPEVPEEFMFDIDATPMDPELVAFSGRQRSGKGGGRGLIFSQDRGRYIKPMLPKGKVVRLAGMCTSGETYLSITIWFLLSRPPYELLQTCILFSFEPFHVHFKVDATLRASAPYQRSRRQRAIGTKNESRGVHIEQGDVRIKKMARKAGSLIIFVVDASGSMALNRMNAAKGAAMSLLTEAYQSRDSICLIPFQGMEAEVLLPPTRSIAMASRRLEQMPCGGGSPLADAIQTACLTGINAQSTGDIGKVVVVLISDGRANVPLCVSAGEEFDPDADEDSKDGKPSRNYLKEEVLACSKKLGALPGFNLLCIDTENKFISTGLAEEIAKAAGGRYHQIAKADKNALASVTSQALSAIKNE